MIERLEDVRPGDLFLGPIGGAAGVAVRLGQMIVDGGWKVGPLDVRHIGVVVDSALPGMVRGDYVHGALRKDGNSYVRGHWDDQAWPTVQGRGPLLAQAMPGGAEIIEMRYDTHWTKRCAFARIPEDYPGQAADAAAIARLMAERQIGYSWPSYPALAAYRLGYKAPRLTEWIGRTQPAVDVPLEGKWINRPRPSRVRLPVEAICSVFADQAWSLAGKRVMEGTHPMAVTPSQLGQRLLFEMAGVEWGWPQRGGRDFILG